MLKDKNIVLGVTGGIAAYKAADLASKLAQGGAKVTVVMTKSATEFVQPMTFEALTGNPVVTEMFGPQAAHGITHINLADNADAVVIAPATANIIGKIAGGISDDMLTCIVLATKAPVIVCPAMHNNMYVNPITQENIEKLKKRGFHIVPAAHGRLASGDIGYGRLPDTPDLLGHILTVLGRNGDLKGRHVVVSAGGTREPLDPVRYVGNRSSGKMGFAIADAAKERGARVTLVTTITPPVPSFYDGVRMVETVAEMREAVLDACQKADVLVMAAAVSDFRAADISDQKIKKKGDKLTLELVQNADFLLELKDNFIKVGFAAETQDLLPNAQKKLTAKRLDLIVANDVTKEGSGFGTDTNEVTFIGKSGKPEPQPLLTKREVADRILDRVVGLMAKKRR